MFMIGNAQYAPFLVLRGVLLWNHDEISQAGIVGRQTKTSLTHRATILYFSKESCRIAVLISRQHGNIKEM
jgi:hypothetical protein